MKVLKRRYMEEADDGKGGSTGDDGAGAGGDGGEKGEVGITKDDLDAVLKTVGDLAKSVEGLHVGFGEVKEGMSKKPEPDAPDPKTLDIANLETMSRQEFATQLMDTVVDRMKREIFDPLADKVGNVEEKASANDVKALVREAEGNHKDFWDWKDEIGTRVKANPYLSPEDAYTLSRSADSKKAEELDKKYAEGGTKDDIEKGGKGGKRSFGGMPPAGGKTTPSQKMTKHDAAEAAWDEVMTSSDSGE